jgi:hypothetical protein
MLPPPDAPLLPGSVEQYLAIDVPICNPTDRVAHVRAALVGRRHESVGEVAVCAAGDAGTSRLLGLIAV